GCACTATPSSAAEFMLSRSTPRNRSDGGTTGCGLHGSAAGASPGGKSWIPHSWLQPARTTRTSLVRTLFEGPHRSIPRTGPVLELGTRIERLLRIDRARGLEDERLRAGRDRRVGG